MENQTKSNRMRQAWVVAKSLGLNKLTKECFVKNTIAKEVKFLDVAMSLIANNDSVEGVKTFLNTKFEGDVKSFLKTHRDYVFNGDALSTVNSIIDFNEFDKKSFWAIESKNNTLLEIISNL